LQTETDIQKFRNAISRKKCLAKCSLPLFCILFFSCRWGWRCPELGPALGFVSANLPTHPSSSSFCPWIYLSCRFRLSSTFCASFVNSFRCGTHLTWQMPLIFKRFQLGIWRKRGITVSTWNSFQVRLSTLGYQQNIYYLTASNG